jgi:hypothetical protein
VHPPRVWKAASVFLIVTVVGPERVPLAMMALPSVW